MKHFWFTLNYHFVNDEKIFKINLGQYARSQNEAFAKACVSACKFCEGKNKEVVSLELQ